MFETGRRSAISSSELGLYSDRTVSYQRNRYNHIIRKTAIGVMVIVAIVLVAIFLYDFTSATSANSKMSQETKHIYILQNALKKSSNGPTKLLNSTSFAEARINGSGSSIFMQDRSDDEKETESSLYIKREERAEARSDTIYQEPETKSQNLHNFKLRKRVLKSIENVKDEEEEVPEGKQFLNNHAMVYRLRQRYKRPDSEEDAEDTEDDRPTPFHWEFQTPHPTSFKRYKYPQLSQYRYPHSSRNIQDIIKYLTHSVEMPNRGIKFTGVYVSPKKHDLYPELEEMMSNSDRSEEEEQSPYSIGFAGDPFYQYKPQHPADVNLLATSNVRFSPTGIHRYNPYHDSFYNRPPIHPNNKPSASETSYESLNPYASLQKKRKPRPFSVMLDIYPITDVGEPTKRVPKQKLPAALEDYELRRPISFNRNNKYYHSSASSPPIVSLPHQQPLTEEEERQQMIFHLNLYPRRRNKFTRKDIIQKSENMMPEERQQLMDKIMSPIDSIAKHLRDQANIEESKQDEPETNTEALTRYQESPIDERTIKTDTNNSEEAIVPLNHRRTDEEYKHESQKMTTEENCLDCDEPITASNDSQMNINEKTSIDAKDIDTIEGFDRFSDSLLATD
ncbi:uncharacterized protein [Prorops nasuta]|uniref:uncharacterized protein n=1 Tax=Prorops nasuta TaxID=863751 RepID=UPI0034CEFE07